MSNDKYPQFTKDRLIEIATQALHRLIEVDNEAACELMEDELDLSFDEMKFFEVFDTITHSLYSEIDEELALIERILNGETSFIIHDEYDNWHKHFMTCPIGNALYIYGTKISSVEKLGYLSNKVWDAT